MKNKPIIETKWISFPNSVIETDLAHLVAKLQKQGIIFDLERSQQYIRKVFKKGDEFLDAGIEDIIKGDFMGCVLFAEPGIYTDPDFILSINQKYNEPSFQGQLIYNTGRHVDHNWLDPGTRIRIQTLNTEPKKISKKDETDYYKETIIITTTTEILRNMYKTEPKSAEHFFRTPETQESHDKRMKELSEMTRTPARPNLIDFQKTVGVSNYRPHQDQLDGGQNLPHQAQTDGGAYLPWQEYPDGGNYKPKPRK